MRKPPFARSAVVAVRLAKPVSSVACLVRHDARTSSLCMQQADTPKKRCVGANSMHGNRQIILPRKTQVNSHESQVEQGFFAKGKYASQSRRIQRCDTGRRTSKKSAPCFFASCAALGSAALSVLASIRMISNSLSPGFCRLRNILTSNSGTYASRMRAQRAQ